MKIKINGIFGKYNNTVDLDKKCNIFIGENGIGKSTTMKIINSFLLGNYIDLLKYSFDSIEVIDNNDKFKFKYEDLFPDYKEITSIVQKYPVKNNGKEIYREEVLNEYKYVEELYCDKSIYLDLVRETVKYISNNKYSINLEKFRRKYINTLGEKSFTELSDSFKNRVLYCSSKKINNYLVSGNIINEASTLIEILYSWILPTNSNCFIETNFYKRKTYKKMDDLLKDYRESFFISSVKDINIINTGDGKESYYSRIEIQRELNSYKKIINNLIKEDSKPHKGKNLKLSDHIDNLLFKREEDLSKDINYYENRINFEGYLIILKELFDKYSVNQIIDSIIYDSLDSNIKDLYKIDEVNISRLLFINYYSKDLIKSFVADYYNMLFKMVNHSYSDEELDIDMYYNDSDLREKAELFILPLIPKNSIFKKYFNTLVIGEYELKVFNKFVHDNIEKYCYCTNKCINNLNDIFSNYFKSKTVTCTPLELVISNSSKYSRDIDFDSLSEGERRVILLFVLSLLTENDVLIVDEPETSLSVIWQKELIKDMLEVGKFKKLLVATQSPFIVDDDKLMEYVNCLPGDDVDE